ncbi:MAG TPA: HAMP domain-containing sensor histidine kinase [Mycobacteriales bacterium]|nr:HAMP domain-containing sensor histidine kinase [Mycobacteriales bacterium]
MRPTLRARLVLAAAVAVAFAVSGVVAVGYLVVRHELLGQVDRQLTAQADRARRLADLLPPARQVPPLRPRFGDPGAYLQVTSTSGPVGQPSDQTVTLPVTDADRAVAAGRLDRVIRNATVADVPVRMVTVAGPAGSGTAIQVALPIDGVTAQLNRLTVAFVALGVAGLAAAVVLARLVARPALAPVSELTETAERIAATRDLTHRIAVTRHDELGRLAASFNSMLQALEESVGAQRQLVADASHELRTPLASLRTNVEILHRVDELDPATREQVLTAIVGQVEELTGLIGDVVELARGEEPAQQWAQVRFDPIVRHAAARAGRHWPGIAFDVRTEPVLVLAVPGRLDRAVANLLDNAAKFGAGVPGESPPGRVAVTLAADGRLTIRDHGPGIPAEALPHVFDRFFRADQARGLPGSGLGLAIVAQVAASHGGRVAIRNDPDGGAVAELTIPPLDGEAGP